MKFGAFIMQQNFIPGRSLPRRLQHLQQLFAAQADRVGLHRWGGAGGQRRRFQRIARYAEVAQGAKASAMAPFPQTVPDLIHRDVQPVGQPAADIVNALAQARVVDLRLIERQAKRQQTAA